jgi:single-strand DNA-binding protein
MNTVILTGRLTRDSEIRYTGGGTAICNFSIAVNERYKAADGWKESVSFFDVTLWGKAGESLHPYLVKGKPVVIEGKLKQERWEAKDGQKHSKVSITADAIEFTGEKSGDSPREKPSGTKPPPEPQESEPFFDDDIPF